MKIWFTADWHLGDKRLNQLFERPFKTVEENTEILIAKHNEVVSPDDVVIVNGDVALDADYLPHVARFNGKKTLIRGNHDKEFSDDEFGKYFEYVIDEGAGIYMDCCGVKSYVTHYPTQSDPDCYNLVGHIHGVWRLQLNMINVGVDVHHFYPISSEMVKFYFDASAKYYDDDVWAAYGIANTKYVGTRGKKGRYFNSTRQIDVQII